MWARTRLSRISAASDSGRARATARSRSICRTGVAGAVPTTTVRVVMRRATALRRELPAASHSVSRARFAARRADGGWRLRAGLQARRRELRERGRRGAQQLARAAERPVAEHREPERRALDACHPPARARGCLLRKAERRGFRRASLTASIAQRLAGETLMVNELYLVGRLSAGRGAAPSLLSQACCERRRRRISRAELDDALDACEKLAQTVDVVARALRARAAGRLRARAGAITRACSSSSSCLLNGESRRGAAAARAAQRSARDDAPVFGTEAIEYRLPTQTRFGAMLGIKEYADADDGRHVQRAAVGAVPVRADAVVRVSDQSDGPGAAAAPVQPHGERRRLRGEPGRGAARTRSMR